MAVSEQAQASFVADRIVLEPLGPRMLSASDECANRNVRPM